MTKPFRPMPPRYAETMMLDAQAGASPVLSDVELLARSYLWALECIAAETAARHAALGETE